MRRSVATRGTPATYDGWEYPLFRRMRDAVQGQATPIAISYGERVDVTWESGEGMEQARVQYVSGIFGATLQKSA